jgi:hypothetical protein
MLGNYSVAAQLVASQVVLSSTELVSWLVDWLDTICFVELDELKEIQEGALKSWFRVLSQHFTARVQKNHEKLLVE